MDPPPPPPPPHGEMPKSSGLPPGKYDIFIIPPHSSGSGFLYLPSLKPNVNSFAAGFASALILVALASAILPTVHLWWNAIRNSGGAGMMLVSVGLAIGAWSLGRMQNDSGNAKTSGNGQGDASAGAPPGGPPPRGGARGAQGGFTPRPTRGSPPPHGYGAGGGGPPPQNGYAGGAGGWSPPNNNDGWQRSEKPPPQPQPGGYANPGAHDTGSTPNNHNTDSSNARPKPQPSGPSGWERAREETRRKEEERKRAAELQRQKEEAERKLRAEKEEAERKLKEAREKEQREREVREAARERIAREAREARAARDAKLAQEKREKEEAAKKAAEAEAKAKADLDKKKADAWAAAKAQAQAIQAKQAAARKKEAEEAAARQAAAAGIPTEKRQGSAYAYSAMGEKTNPWPRGYPTAPASVSGTTATATPRAAPGSAAAAAAARGTPSPTKRPAPPPANAKTFTGTEDSYSYRPYDTPKQSSGHKKAASSIYSGTSYAESATTSATSAPPSMRGAYSTKDPDKIVIKAVYAFTNAFSRAPVTQLVSGTGSVTDGLILRITTEGLFIDDDVRHVPQREWDVKAWTLKLVEVGCPCFPRGFGIPAPVQNRKLFGNNSKPKPEGVLCEDADKALVELLGACKGACRLGLSPSSASGAGNGNGSQADNRAPQTGQSAKLHVLRASIRDQEGRKYVFVIGEEEGWKIATGLQRLRKGTQVRALGVSGMSKSDCAGTLSNLGWA